MPVNSRPKGSKVARCMHPNAEWKTALGGIAYRGHVGIAKGFDQLAEAAQDWRVKLKEVHDLGGDNVLAVVENEMKGKASDIDIKGLIFSVITVRDSLIIRVAEYLEREEALEAAGLSE